MRKDELQIGSGGLAYVVVTTLVFAAAIQTQANLLFWGFGLMLGSLVVSILTAAMMLRRVSVQRVMPAHAQVDQPLVLRYRVINEGRFPAMSIVVQERWAGQGWFQWLAWNRDRDVPGAITSRPCGFVLHVPAHGVAYAHAPTKAVKRGVLTLHSVVLTSAFPFGILQCVVRFVEPQSLLVYPRLYHLRPALLTRLTGDEATSDRTLPRAGGHHEFFGLRPYRPGDRLKHMDWKHTAKTGRLVTREMSKPALPELSVALDLTATANGTLTVASNDASTDEAFERAVSLTASLVHAAHNRGIRVGLDIPGAVHPVMRPQHHAMHHARMLETLARLNRDDVTREAAGAGASHPASIVVRPGASVRSRSNRQMVLAGDDLHVYVSQGLATAVSHQPSVTAGGTT